MKLKYIFMFLGVMLLGLTACGKKDTPDPSNKNPFAGTKWENIHSVTDDRGETETTVIELHFIDDSRVAMSSSYKVTAPNGSIVRQDPTSKGEGTYTYEGLVATVITEVVEEGKLIKHKGTLTMDAAKQKITALEEGEDKPLILTRKK